MFPKMEQVDDGAFWDFGNVRVSSFGACSFLAILDNFGSFLANFLGWLEKAQFSTFFIVAFGNFERRESRFKAKHGRCIIDPAWTFFSRKRPTPNATVY